jgi:hypothetical protein
MARYAARILDARGLERTLARPDLGEDWVVPREATSYLVAATGPPALISFFDGQGRLTGEVLVHTADLRSHLASLEAAGILGPVEVLPPGAIARARLLGAGPSGPAPPPGRTG